MKPFWIVFKHNDGRFEIWKEYDNTHVWDAPTYEVVGYFDNRNDAVACVKKCKTNNLIVKEHMGVLQSGKKTALPLQSRN